MPQRLASCSCGQLSVLCDGDPDSVSLCHCLACQKRTGSTYGIAAFYEAGRVAIRGNSSDYVRPSDSGHDVAFHFCPHCGSTVYWLPARKPGMVAVAAGSFADPNFPAPTQDVHREHRHPWVTAKFPISKD